MPIDNLNCQLCLEVYKTNRTFISFTVNIMITALIAALYYQLKYLVATDLYQRCLSNFIISLIFPLSLLQVVKQLSQNFFKV